MHSLSLLQQIGVVPDRVLPPDIDESLRRDEVPAAYAARLASEKAQAAALMMGGDPQALVLAADTVVCVGRRIIPKPENEKEAAQALSLLSGRGHRVMTAVALRRGDGRIHQRLVETRLAFKRLSHSEQAAYLASSEWRGKAGGYAIQGLAAAYIDFLSGSYSGVVGLPLYETAQLLGSVGIKAKGMS